MKNFCFGTLVFLKDAYMSDVKDAVVSATYSLACFVYVIIIFVYFLIVYTGPFLSFSPKKVISTWMSMEVSKWLVSGL